MKKVVNKPIKKLAKNQVGSRSAIKLNLRPLNEEGKLSSRTRRDTGLDFVFFFSTQHTSSAFLFCFERGVEFFKYRKYSFASNMFQKAVDLDNTQISAINNLGISLIKLQNLPEGVKNLHRITKLDKFQEFSYYNIALAYVLFDKHHEAQLCMQSAESLLPSLSENFLHLKQIIEKLLPIKPKLPLSCIRKWENPIIHISKSMIFNQKVIQDLNPLNLSKVSITSIDDSHSVSSIDEFTVKMDSKLIELKENVKKTIRKLESKKIKPAKSLDTKYVTEEELRTLLAEFSKETAKKDFAKIDSILAKLSFLGSFPVETRHMIYSISSIKECRTGDVVFRQGEMGECMYVVIKGSVSVEKKGPEFGNLNIVVNTVYDGSQFGKVALLNAVDSKTFGKERTASCIACEQSTLLCIPKDSASQLILSRNQEDLNKKIETLSSTPFFKGFNKSELVSLAMNLNILSYKLNDIILKKGEVPTGLYVIHKGFADIINNVSTVQDKEAFAGRLQRNQTPMYFSRNPPERPKTSKSPDLDKKSSQKLFRTETKTEKFLMSSLREGDFFGSRALKDLFDGKRKVSPCKFDVVVQSSVAEVFLISNYHLQFISQDMFIQMTACIGKSDDPDCPKEMNEKELKKLTSCWIQYKSQLIRNIYKDSRNN